METMFDTVIIGAGAAGLTAGIYTSRANMKSILLEKFVPGGQTALTAFVENFPGFPDGVSGFDLMENMRKQAVNFGLEVKTAEVKFINSKDDYFCIGTTVCELNTRTIIVCTGVRPRKLNVPGERELFGKGVSTCATCDGAFYRDMEVAVIGGGDSALDEGLYLTRFASKVHIIHRRDKFRAIPTYVMKAREHPKVVFHTDTVVTSINGAQSVESLSLRNVKTGVESTLPAAGVFLYIGLLPNTEMFRGLLDLDEGGFIRVDFNLQTSVPGIFAAGDVRVTPLRQIVTAASDGAVAAMASGKYLEHLE
ncbi:thioredoxin-disulfide reductase [bacterium]|nr:thioredoxin-disulfide reductase [bacterium]